MNSKGYSLVYVLIGLISLFLAGIVYYKLIIPSKSINTIPSSIPIMNPTLTPIPLNFTSPSLPPLIKYIPHLAGDPTVSLQKIKIVTVILKPNDITLSPELDWKMLMNNWYKDVVSYWQTILGDKASISYETYTSIIEGNSGILSYDFNKAYIDTSYMLKNNSELSADFSKNSPEYLVLIIYVLNDGQHLGLISKGSATYSGTIGTSVIPLGNGLVTIGAPNPNPNVGGTPLQAEEIHEIGHALGLKHSSDYPDIVKKYFIGNKWNSTCDLMIAPPYDQYFQRKFVPNGTLSDDYCLLPEMKNLFFN